MNEGSERRKTYLTGGIENLKDTGHSLVVNDLLVSVLNSGIVLIQRGISKRVGVSPRSRNDVFVCGAVKVYCAASAVQTTLFRRVERE